MLKLASPIPWVGGKARIAPKIVQAFPHPSQYKVFVDLFAGSLSILFSKPQSGQHMEVANDANNDLINFWTCLQSDAEYIKWKLRTLPYSQRVYQHFRDSLVSGEFMHDIERAVRWFYVQRSSLLGRSGSKTWLFSAAKAKLTEGQNGDARSYSNAVELLDVIQQRLGSVQIHCRDFEGVINLYDSHETLFYADPPYIGTEGYYDGPFDHEVLARALNAAQGKIVLSYQEHDDLEALYPTKKWRRVPINVTRNTANFNQKKEKQAKEVLLCNFEQEGTLF